MKSFVLDGPEKDGAVLVDKVPREKLRCNKKGGLGSETWERI